MAWYDSAVLVMPQVTIWTGKAQAPGPVPRCLGVNGKANLIKAEHIVPFNSLKARARRACEAYGHPVGQAVYIVGGDSPALAALSGELDHVGDDWNRTLDFFCDHYDYYRKDWLRSVAYDLKRDASLKYGEDAKWLAWLDGMMPAGPGDARRLFFYGWQCWSARPCGVGRFNSTLSSLDGVPAAVFLSFMDEHKRRVRPAMSVKDWRAYGAMAHRVLAFAYMSKDLERLSGAMDYVSEHKDTAEALRINAAMTNDMSFAAFLENNIDGYGAWTPGHAARTRSDDELLERAKDLLDSMTVLDNLGL